jgi:tetratricopeptide (TPR) repeat protein
VDEEKRREAFVRRWYLFFFALVFWGWASVAGALDWKALHEKADQGDPQALLTQAQREPRSLEALYAAGLVCLDLYRVDEAQVFFQRMLSLDSKSVEARWGLVEISRRRHQLGQGESILREITQKAPDYAPACITLAYILFDKEDYDQAIALAQRVLRGGEHRVDRADRVRAYLIIGGAKGMIANQGGPFSKLVQGTQVMGYLKHAQRLDPGSPAVYFGMGSFYALAPGMAGGDKKKGIALLEKAVAVDPNFVDAYARLAQVWFAKGDKEKYRSYLAQAEVLDPQANLVLKAKALEE